MKIKLTDSQIELIAYRLFELKKSKKIDINIEREKDCLKKLMVKREIDIFHINLLKH